MIHDERDLQKILQNENILGAEVASISSFCARFRHPTPPRSPKEYVHIYCGKRIYKGNAPEGAILVVYSGGKKRMYSYNKTTTPICDVYNNMLRTDDRLETL